MWLGIHERGGIGKRMYVMTARYLRASLMLCLALSALIAVSWVPHTASRAILDDARQYVASLSPAERKMPQALVVADRLSRQAFVLANAVPMRNAAGSGSSTNLYKVLGSSTQQLQSALDALGLTASSISRYSPELHIKLTDRQVIDLARFEGIERIRFAVPPRPQGAALAKVVHRSDELLKAGQPTTGAGVVIAIISSVFNGADVTALQQKSQPPIPGNDDLFVMPGASVTTGGAFDALAFLQVAYAVAPNARFILASPGESASAAGMAATIDDLVAGDSIDTQGRTIPVPHIIVDDLLFTTESPFVLGAIEQAVQDAVAAGVVYVTAAGDLGGVGKSGVYASNAAPILDDGAWIHPYPDNSGVLEVDQALADICFYTSRKPTVSPIDDPLMFVQNPETDATDQPVTRTYVVDGEGCLSEGNPDVTINVGATAEIIFVDDAQERVLVFGPRADDVALNDVASAFNHTTPGGILGHAFLPEVVTVGAAVPCFQLNIVASFKACDATPSVAAFSSQGDSAPRFYWELVLGEPEFEYVIAPQIAPALKPDVLGLNELLLDSVSGSDDLGMVGTSVAAMGVAGVAALNWEFRSDPSPTSYTSAEVADALRASGLSFDEGHTETSGYGPLDAPRAAEELLFDEPLVPQNASLTGVVGGVELYFERSLDDSSASFYYRVDCGSVFSGDVEPGAPKKMNVLGPVSCAIQPRKNELADPFLLAQVVLEAEATEVTPVAVTMTPRLAGATLQFAESELHGDSRLVYQARCTINDIPITGWDPVNPKTDALPATPHDFYSEPGNDITCDVRVVLTENSTAYESAWTTDSATAEEIPDPSVVMAPKSGGVTLQFTEPTALVGVTGVSYQAACTENNAPISGWNPKDGLVPGTIYALQARADRSVECTVKAVLITGNGNYTSPGNVETATALEIPNPSISITGDQGGISIVWSVANLADPNMATGLLNCVNSDNVTIINNQSVPYGGGFIEAEAGTTLSCRLSTTVTVNGGSPTNYQSNVFEATPEEESISGLPIWLLYEAAK